MVLDNYTNHYLSYLLRKQKRPMNCSNCPDRQHCTLLLLGKRHLCPETEEEEDLRFREPTQSGKKARIRYKKERDFA